MPRVPHILHVFPSFEPGGSQRRTTALMTGWGNRLRHSVLAMNGTMTATSMLPDDFPLETLPAPAGGGFWKTQRALADLIRAAAPDLVCTYNWGAIESVIAARRTLGLPVLHHEDGFGPDEAHGQKARRVWTRRVVLRRAQAVVVPSHNLGRIARESWRLPERLLHVVPNGVELERFAQSDAKVQGAALRAALGIPADAFVVGSVGTLREEKNYPRFVRALAQLHAEHPELNAHALLVGAGPEQANIERAIEQAGVRDRVRLAGHQTQCAPYLWAMDVFALSSETEQMPISLVEAFAANVPAVTMDVGDAARMMPAGCADLIIPLHADAEGLAEAWARLAADPARRVQLAAAGRAKAIAEYSVETMLATYLQLYDSAMAR